VLGTNDADRESPGSFSAAALILRSGETAGAHPVAGQRV